MLFSCFFNSFITASRLVVMDVNTSGSDNVQITRARKRKIPQTIVMLSQCDASKKVKDPKSDVKEKIEH